MSANCTKDFEIRIGLLELLGYWNFNEAAGSRADSHGSNDLAIVGNGCNSGAGIISNAAVFDLGGPFPSDGLANAAVAGLDWDVANGMTLAGWFFVTAYNPFQSASMFVLSSTIDWNLSIIKAVGDQITFNIGTDLMADNIQLYGALGPFNVWIFVRAWVSPIDRLIHAKVNEGTEIVGTVTYASSFVPTGQAGLFCQSTTPWVWRNDEWGIWRGVMTDAQGAFLYNGGVGRTYPDVPGI